MHVDSMPIALAKMCNIMMWVGLPKREPLLIYIMMWVGLPKREPLLIHNDMGWLTQKRATIDLLRMLFNAYPWFTIDELVLSWSSFQRFTGKRGTSVQVESKYNVLESILYLRRNECESMSHE